MVHDSFCKSTQKGGRYQNMVASSLFMVGLKGKKLKHFNFNIDDEDIIVQ